MTFLRTVLVFIGLGLSLGSHAQITFPINIHDGQTLETCSGYFVDSGGDTLTPYQPNENFSVVFCSDEEDQLLTLAFQFFQLGSGDVLHIYDGENNQAPLLVSATNSQLQGQTLYASGSCFYVEFVSSPSEQGLGWFAELECVTLCETFQASITPQAGTFDYCPDAGNLTFTGSATYLPENADYNPALFTFEWYVDGATYTGSQVTHFLTEPGAYNITLTVEDPQHGCVASLTEVIRLGTIPSFDGTISTVSEACAGEPFSLVGMATPEIWTGFPTSVVETVPIPDGTGDYYESSLEFDIFDEEDVILSAADFSRICLNIEHVAYGQVQFELECPNGATVMLKDFGMGSANLGEPVVWDNVTPGVGYEYCFSPTPLFGTMEQTSPLFHEYTDQAGNYYFNAAYLPPGSYTPDETLDALTGCPLNGEWTLRVRDNVPGDNGHMFGWSLFFRDEFYPDSLIFATEIVEETWYFDGNPLSGNPAVATVNEPGEHIFIFEVTDNFGCVYDTTVAVTILPLPVAEIISELEIPVCEGDSTLLTVTPIEGDPYYWVYQWMIGASEIPGAVYDTLMAKEPVSYTVMVQDTLSGCMDFFDFQLTQQNCDLTIPNVFTPNGDGINDVFEILNLEHYQAQIVIFNRWGKRVFEHSDYYGNWWDGRNQPDGVYYYVLTYTRGGERREAHGAVTIVR
jgi:large repetitive protein